MNASIQNASDVKAPHREHSLTHNPVVRRVLKEGAGKLWGVKDLMGLLGMSERAAQNLLSSNLTSVAFPMRPGGDKPGAKKLRHKATAGALLLYLLQHSKEMPLSEVLAAQTVILDQLPSDALAQLKTYLEKKLQHRAARPVLVVSEGEAPKSGQLVFFNP
ncbi:MAG: hypothetical protein V4662_11850 [Verrucomicrobiota bacterium]